MSKMGFINPTSIKLLVSIEQVLEHYDLLQGLNRRGNILWGKCPIHNGHNETQFRVNLKKNSWNCFTCDKGGNIIDFVAAKENVRVCVATSLIQKWFEIQTIAHPERKLFVSYYGRAQ
jgi:hypothetical protein